MKDQITPEERRAIEEFLDWVPKSHIRKKPGSAYDPDSPNYTPNAKRFRPTSPGQRAMESRQRKVIRDGMNAGKTSEQIAKSLKMTVKEYEALKERIGVRVTHFSASGKRGKFAPLPKEVHEYRIGIIRDFIADGRTVADVCNKLRLSARYVLKIAHENGLQFGRKGKNDPKINVSRIRALYEEGFNGRQIAQRMKAHPDTVRHWVRKFKAGE